MIRLPDVSTWLDGHVHTLNFNLFIHSLIQFFINSFQVVELKPGGKDICVDNSNKIEYIHLMADYKLNRQVHSVIGLSGAFH